MIIIFIQSMICFYFLRYTFYLNSFELFRQYVCDSVKRSYHFVSSWTEYCLKPNFWIDLFLNHFGVDIVTFRLTFLVSVFMTILQETIYLYVCAPNIILYQDNDWLIDSWRTYICILFYFIWIIVLGMFVAVLHIWSLCMFVKRSVSYI